MCGFILTVYQVLHSAYHTVLFTTFFLLSQSSSLGALGMAQPIKVLAVKPKDLNLIPGTHVMEGGNQLSLFVISSLYICSDTHICTHNM